MKASISKRIKMMGICLLSALLAVVLFGCGGSGSSGNSSTGTSNATETGTSAPASNELTFDTPFEFDDLTITLGSGVTATTLENEFSDHANEQVAAIPITIVNNASSSHGLNMFYYKAYSPDGAELDNITAFFMEDDVAFAGDVRSGATQQSVMHILYTGPGDYYIEFAMPLDNDPIEVKLPLNL